MPLAELLSMYKDKVDVTQQTASMSTDPSCRPDTDCVELVWENGQIMMQSQSNKARKGPVSNNFQTNVPKSQDIRNANGSKMAKFGTMDSVLGDFSLPVSCEMGLDQGVDMVPWLNYPIEDNLHNDCASDFLHELSGVTLNDLSTENHLVSREKKGGFHGDGHTNAVDNDMNFKNWSTFKAPSITQKHARGESSEVPQFSQTIQHSVPRSGVSDASGNNTVNPDHLTSRDPNPSLCAFTSLRLQKLDAGQTSTSSGFTNFSYFSRPAAVARAYNPAVDSSNKLKNGDKRCDLASSNHVDSTLVNMGNGYSQQDIHSNNQSHVALVKENSELLPAKPAEELFSSNQATRREEVARNDAAQNQAYGAMLTKAGMAGEKNMEPVVATSSVCSANSVERAPNEPAHDLKRKSRETGDSEGPSEDIEEESVGAKKANCRTSSKRSRAAEVHNLSERRRRDRINEKMRALQELIPNCNKVDKASMLDEAIEYLKTLQVQVQILSMGAGLYMQPMMLPPGMQPIHGAHMPHLPPMGVGMGMGMGMGYGMNMLDINSGMKMMPFQGLHYPVPGTGPNFHGMPGSSLQAFGHPGQGLPMSMQRAPAFPMPGAPPLKTPMGPNISGVAGSTNGANLAPASSSKDVGSQVMPSNNVNSSMNQASNQVANEGERLSMSHVQPQAANVSETAIPASRADTMPS